MKKLLFIIVILGTVVSVSYAEDQLLAWNPMTVGGGEEIAVGGCTALTGDQTFIWNMEHLTDIEQGTPCGSSEGATTGTALGGAAISAGAPFQDGGNSLVSGNDDSVSFASSGILTLAGEGTVSMYIYVTDWTANTNLTEYFAAAFNGDNWLTFYSNYDDPDTDFMFKIEGSNDPDQQFLNSVTTPPNETWIRVMFSWDVNEDAVDKTWLWVDLDADGVEDGGESGTNDARTIGNMTETATFEIGDADVDATGDDVSYIDNLYITDVFQSSL